MVGFVLFIFESIVSGITGNFAYEKGKAYFNTLNTLGKRFILKIKLFIITRKLIKDNKLNYMVLRRVFKKTNAISAILDHVSGRVVSCTKEKLIEDNAMFLHEECINSGITIPTANILYFLDELYNEVNEFYKSFLTKSDLYLAGIIEKSASSTNEGTEKIINLLTSQNELKDDVVVWEVYRSISNKIIYYELEDAHSLLPLLEGKSDSLFDMLTLLEDLAVNGNVVSARLKNVLDSIDSMKIKLDLVSKVVYLAIIFEDEELIESINHIDERFDKLLQFVRNNMLQDLFNVSEKSIEGVKQITYEIKDIDDEYAWIYKRLCVISMLQSNVINASKNIELLLKDDITPVDSILIFEKKAVEYCSRVNLEQEEIDKMIADYLWIEQKVTLMPMKMQVIYFATQIRLSLNISAEKALLIINNLSKEISNNPKIIMLKMQAVADRKSDAIDVDYLMDLCIKNNEFWLINNYLVDLASKDPDKAKAIIEKYRFICDKDVNVFLIYVQLINLEGNKEEAKKLIMEYEGKYNKHLEYWIDRIRIINKDSDIENVKTLWKNGSLEMTSREAAGEFIKILHNNGEHSFVVKFLETGYYKDNLTPDLLYLKSISLLELDDELNAFEELKRIPDDCNFYNNVLRNIIAIAINNKRVVPVSVLNHAMNSEDASILSLTALYSENEGEHDKAKELVIKALLRSSNSSDLAFGNYFAIYKIYFEEETKIESINKGTCVTLMESQSGECRTYCVHEYDVIPQVNYLWENAIHITVEEAIQLKLFRKKIDDFVFIEGREFRILKLESLHSFLFEICTNKLIERGDARIITLPVDNNGQLDRKKMVEVIRENVGDNSEKMMWLEQYKDLYSMPIPFYMSTKFTSITYSQLVTTIIEEKSIYFREHICSTEFKDKPFILSFSSLVTLSKLGYDEHFRHNCFIAESTGKIIDHECNHIITDNNREHVATMGVHGDDVFVFEYTEQDKAKRMEDAVALKKLKNSYEVKENIYKTDFERVDNLDVKRILGIADYDTLAIAKGEGYVVVSSEIPLSVIAKVERVGVITVPLMDYIAETCEKIETLIEMVKKAIEFKFLLPITSKVIERVECAYNEADELNKKYIIDSFAELTRLEFVDLEYKDYIGQTIGQIIHDRQAANKSSEFDKLLIRLCFILRGFRMLIDINESGELITAVIDREGNFVQ